MDLRVLGPVEASDGDQPVAIGAGKPRAVLAMLALSEGMPISADQLIDGLWGETPPATAPKMVQGYVSHLRKAFAAAGNGAEIVTRGRSYELRLGDGGDLDVRRFERLVAAGTPRAPLRGPGGGGPAARRAGGVARPAARRRRRRAVRAARDPPAGGAPARRGRAGDLAGPRPRPPRPRERR